MPKEETVMDHKYTINISASDLVAMFYQVTAMAITSKNSDLLEKEYEVYALKLIRAHHIK